MKLPYAVYILKCSDNTYYTGFTTDIEKRLIAHDNREVHYTKSRLPLKLVNLFQFESKQNAYDFERYLKSGSGIAFRNKRFI
ncbi:GIY-YIG nuclease family protein [Winogradskyella sp.]|uniref:GIY-YIG nuclease family protein n=1 Tax=Winogradskyella sp. TaxID=1883156 RepID=UPI00261B1DC7|nr:GIY-YIG nuclease family protein [Winogradskyella sp.]